MSGLNRNKPSVETYRSNDLELDPDDNQVEVFFSSQSSQLRLVEVSLDQDQSERKQGNVRLLR